MIHEVIKNNKGNFPGVEEFVKQVAALKLDTLRGSPSTIDEMRNPVHNIYIKKVEKKKMFGYDKEELWNTVIKTYPNVSPVSGSSTRMNSSKTAGLRPATSPPCKFCN